jgi:hypothetical protein
MKQMSFVLLLTGLVIPQVRADTVLVMEDFESYANTDALLAVWRPANGNSTTYWTPADPAYQQATLVDSNFNANAFPMGGKGVAHLGGVDSSTNTAVLEWNGLNSDNAISPSATQNIVLEGDIFDSGPTANNRRMSIALRSTQPANLIELGFWNANTCDPTVDGCVPGSATPASPGFYPATQYAARTALFSPVRPEPLVTEPNWQYFQLPPELDRDSDADEFVNKADIGEGWHHFKATVSESSIKLEIDLFRDGLRNTAVTPDETTGIRPGAPGVDAIMTWPLTPNAGGFNSLRIGGPSGLTSIESPADNEAIFDNIKLALVDVVMPGNQPDFNGNGTVDAADYVLWRNNQGLMGGATFAQGDANSDGNVDSADYGLWRAGFGMSAPGGAGLGAAAVPEPGSLVLLSIGVASLLNLNRRRLI